MKFSLPMPLKRYSMWVVLLLTLAVFCILVNLGFWQLSRSEQKAAIEQLLQVREQAPAIKIDELHAVEFEYLTGAKVSADLTPLEGRYLLLDNQVFQGKVGYLAYQLMTSRSGLKVFLERGFVPAKAQRDQLPDVVWINEPIYVVARLYQRSVNPLSDRLYMETASPHRVQNLNIEQIGQIWEENIEPYVLQPMSSDWPYPQPWQPVPLSAKKHLGYAVQWFSMASVLLILGGWVAYRLLISREKI
ncbi:SURF1 family protein [Vibrio zhanjiangensis]